jgi:hypothetical protein
VIEGRLVHEAVYVRRTPVGRLGRPEEVTRAAVFLASYDSGLHHRHDPRRRRRLERVRLVDRLDARLTVLVLRPAVTSIGVSRCQRRFEAMDTTPGTSATERASCSASLFRLTSPAMVTSPSRTSTCTSPDGT